jgi:hypothetical protein
MAIASTGEVTIGTGGGLTLSKTTGTTLTVSSTNSQVAQSLATRPHVRTQTSVPASRFRW